LKALRCSFRGAFADRVHITGNFTLVKQNRRKFQQIKACLDELWMADANLYPVPEMLSYQASRCSGGTFAVKTSVRIPCFSRRSLSRRVTSRFCVYTANI
jgi:hypothetical protein